MLTSFFFVLQCKVVETVNQSQNSTDIYINSTEICINSTDIYINSTEFLSFICETFDFSLCSKGVLTTGRGKTNPEGATEHHANLSAAPSGLYLYCHSYRGFHPRLWSGHPFGALTLLYKQGFYRFLLIVRQAFVVNKFVFSLA